MRKVRFGEVLVGSLLMAVTISGCGGGSGPTKTNNKIVVLNHMTPTGYVKDGVESYGLKGPSSKNKEDTYFDFEKPIQYGESETVYLSNDQCDIYWDLTPMAADSLNLIPNTGAPWFVPCGKTVSCTATIKVVDFFGEKFKFADLECSAPQ